MLIATSMVLRGLYLDKQGKENEYNTFSIGVAMAEKLLMALPYGTGKLAMIVRVICGAFAAFAIISQDDLSPVESVIFFAILFMYYL